MRFRLATWNINSVRLRLDLIESLRQGVPAGRALPARDQMHRRQISRARAPRARLAAHRGGGPEGLSRRGHPFPPALQLIERRDICGRGHARHLSVGSTRRTAGRSPSCCTTFTCRRAAILPIPCSTRNFATSSISSRRWIRGSAACAARRQNRMIMVGDLNVAPLPTDVWSHKQLLKVVSHTPAEIERFERVKASHDWVDVMRRHVPRRREALHLVELSQPRLARLQSWPASRPYLDDPGARWRCHRR